MPPNPRPSALGAARNQLSEIISAIERLHKNWCWERSHGQACSGCAASDKAIADLLEIFTRRAQEAVEAATPGIARAAKVAVLKDSLSRAWHINQIEFLQAEIAKLGGVANV